MDCKRCTEDLTAYLDGELSPADSAQVRSHLITCSACTDELRGLQQAADFIESHARELDLRFGSWSRLQAQIPAPKSPTFLGLPFPVRWRTAVAAMACIAAIAFSYYWHQQVQRSSLDAYIAQYEKAREAGRSFRRAIAGVDTAFTSEKFAVDNPFMEAKATLDLNPFRSEDR